MQGIPHEMRVYEALVYELGSLSKKAAEIMGDTEAMTCPSDPVHPINVGFNIVSLKISSLLSKIGCILNKQVIKQRTISVINALKESKVDYTLLLYLQLPESLRSKSELICGLESTCVQMNADFKCEYFYTCVWNFFESEGVLPITPEKFVVANRKQDALNEYDKVKKTWGKHSPLFLQTYDAKDGELNSHLYQISRTSQDGILRLLDILKAGEFAANGRMYKACGAFEHVISLSTLTCQIYDCEIMSSSFDGKKAIEEITEMVQQFPPCLSSIMISKNLVDMEDFIKFTVKNRTRRIDADNVKISFHFTPNICAPKSIHNAATEICLRECKGRIDAGKAAIKNTGVMPDHLVFNDISDSLLSLDYSAIKSNGFTTPFSRKKKSDEFSRLVYIEEVCGGMSINREMYVKTPQDLTSENMSDKERALLIYAQLYTTPKREMICYSASAMKSLASGTTQVKPNMQLKTLIEGSIIDTFNSYVHTTTFVKYSKSDL